MKSMTGYGEAAVQGKLAKIEVQLRTLNHRHLDLQLRIPKEYFSVEDEIRRILRRRISRGRVDLFITRLPPKGKGRRLELDDGLVGQYVRALGRAKKKFRLKGEIELALFSNLPELFQLKEPEVATETEGELVLKTLDSALGNLERSRQREGRALLADIRSHLRHLGKVSRELSKQAKKISARLNGSLLSTEGGDALNSRAETPGAPGWATKGDINEEAVRLGTHVNSLLQLIRAREPVGKKIEFLLQEIQRELNTISSKAPQISVVQLVLAGKDRVEKIREQAQNVE